MATYNETASGGATLAGSASEEITHLNEATEREGPSVVPLVGGTVSVTLDRDPEYE